MTSKQRAYLKSLAMTMDPIFQIGKASLTPEVIEGIREAIDKRELIKVSVLKNCFDDPREIAEVLAERTRSQVVQVIGKKIVLYIPAKENSKIVLQGERSMARDNKQLGLFKLDGIEPAPRGVPQIEVTFSIDVNGIVNVKAKDLKTQKEQSIVIQNSTGLSDEEIDRMVKEAEANKAEDEKKRKDIETRNKAEQMINEIDKALAEQGDKIDANQKQQAEQLKTELKTALDNNDMTTLEAKMSELEQMAQQMASYAYQQQQANPNSGAGQTTSNNNDDNVVDADFEEKN